jgi:hypothetical protein
MYEIVIYEYEGFLDHSSYKSIKVSLKRSYKLYEYIIY